MLLKSPRPGTNYWSRASSTVYPLTTSDLLQIDGAVTFSSTLGVTGLLTASSGANIAGRVNITSTDGSNHIGLVVTQNDATNNPEAANFINAGTAKALGITQNGVLAVNEFALDVRSTAIQVNSGLAQFYNNNTLTAKPAIWVWDKGFENAVFIDKDNYGSALNIDADANSASNITGLTINSANAGAGQSIAANFESGSLIIGDFTTAGFVKNTSTGLISGGNTINHQTDLAGILGSTSYYHVSSGVYSVLSSGLSTSYLLLDASNDPLTGNLEISKVDPEMRLTDTGNSEYTRWLKADTNNQMYLYNRVTAPAFLSSAIVLLMHCDGTQGSTSFTDSSNNPHTMTANGTVNVETTVYEFGTGSAEFDGNGDYITSPDSDDWDFTGEDFTIDLWYRPASTSANQDLISQRQSAVTCPWTFVQVGQTIYFYASTGSGWGLANGQTLGTPTLNTWTHLAVSRTGTTFRSFQDGAQKATWSSTSDFMLSTSVLNIGGFAAWWLNGYLDEIRLSKGTSYYQTSSFSVSTGAYGGTASILEATLIDSKDGVSSGEAGIHTIGQSSGNMVLNGGIWNFQINGTTKAILSSGGYLGMGSTSTPHSHITNAGSFARTVASYSSSVTIGATSDIILCSTGITVTLPTSSGVSGRNYVIKNTSTATVTISPNSTSELLDGATGTTLPNQYDVVQITNNGSNWFII